MDLRKVEQSVTTAIPRASAGVISLSNDSTCSNWSEGNTAMADCKLKPDVLYVRSVIGVIPLIRLTEGALSSFNEAGEVFRISFTANNNHSIEDCMSKRPYVDTIPSA